MVGKKHAGFKDNLEADEHRRSSLFRGLTGRQGADVSGKAGTSPDLRGMLLAAYGPGARGGVNTAAAAQDLGVSRRTVERWVAPEGRQRARGCDPSSDGTRQDRPVPDGAGVR